jgi:transglutaminase-like putative cysteine protease
MTMARPLSNLNSGPVRRAQTLAATLLAGVAYLPLARFMDWRVNAFVAALFALRLAALRWPRANPGPLALVILTVMGVANVLSVHHGLTGQEGGTALFVSMLALKLLELRDRRDLRVFAVLLGFLVVVQFLFDQSMALAAFLGLVSVGLVSLLVALNGGMGSPGWPAVARIGLRLCLQAVPLTLVLFLLFPRLSAPLWSLSLDPGVGVMGMSDRMEPGAISELVINGELAFRVRFDQDPPNADRLYWRGLILWKPDARGWSPGLDPARPVATSIQAVDAAVGYEVLLEPTRQRWLFALDLPLEVPETAHRSGDFQLLAKERITGPERYRARSALDYRTEAPPDWLRERALELPPNITARMRDLVAGWRTDAREPWSIVQAGLAFFNREPFHYTLLPPRLGANPTDEFLFETRRGFCEHFAGSFAVLMRLAGIPSRVVLGYLGGEPNRIGGYHMVWQSDAHAWVEVLIPERGWVRVDPTAAVDPSRVDNSGAARLLGANAPQRFQVDPSGLLARALRQTRLFADSLEAAWQDWVLDFSLDHQRSLLEHLGLEDVRETGLALLMVAASSIVLGLTLWGLLGQRTRPSPLETVYQRFCQRLARAGLPRRPDEGPRDYAERVARARPDLAPSVMPFIALYIRERYSPARSPDGVHELKRCLKGFWPRRTTGETKGNLTFQCRSSRISGPGGHRA